MNCLRCGVEIEDGRMFCADCEQTVAQPLQPSPYLNTHIVLPKRRPAPAKPPQAKKEKKSPERLNARVRRLVVALCLLTVFSLLLAAGCGFGAWAYRDARQTERLLTQQQEENAHLVKELDELREEFSTLQDENTALHESVETLEQTVDRLNRIIDAYRSQ